MDADQRSNNSDCSTPCPSSHLKGDVFASLPSMLVTDFTTDPLTDGNHSDVTSASDDDISMIDTSSSSSSSDDDSSEDSWTDSSTNTNLFDDRPLHSHTSSTVHAFSVDLLEFCRVSRLPKNQRSQLLELFRTYLPSPNLVPVSASSLGSKFLTPFIYVHHWRREIVNEHERLHLFILLTDAVGIGKWHKIDKICGVCQSSTSNGTCSTIHCTHQGMKIPADDLVEIVTFDFVEQLRLLINHNLALLRQYQNQARNKTTSDDNDIVRAEVYQSLLSVHKDFFVSAMIHSDGIPLYKSKNSNGWPILGAVLELPPFARTRGDNILLLALWIGKKKPDFTKLFEKLADQFSRVKDIGIEIHGENRVQVLFPMLMGDMPALSSMVQFVEPQAFYSCMFCNTKGTYNHRGHCVTYPIDDDADLRTSESFQRHGELAASMQPRIDRERTIGLKGVSAFNKILDVPLPHSVVIDSMHTVFLCHSKKLLIHLQSFVSKENLLKISMKLRSINYIHDILRRPRSISNVFKWKASEVRMFILYIGLPVLAEFLPEDESGDLALYVVILRLLHDHWLKDRKRSDAVSSLLKLYIQKLSKKIDDQVYPPNMITITTHTHLHLPLQCKKFGRLDWLTNFVFESVLGFLKAFVKGSSGAGDQIAFAFESNFILSKLKKSSRSFGHFVIDEENFGSNVILIRDDEPLSEFLLRDGRTSANTLLFSRLHHINVTYHSFLYSRKGSACSYLVSYGRQGTTRYGFVLCFSQTNGECSMVVQELHRVDRSLSSCFPSYAYLTAIKDFIDDLYIVVKRVKPSLFDLDDVHICSVDSLQARCFSVPLGSDLMVITRYSCAFEHN